MGKTNKKGENPANFSQSFVDELNTFFCRFDTMDDSAESEEICKNLPEGSPVFITEEAIGKCLAKLKPNKTTGPDGLKARLLKECSPQIKGVLSRLFNFLLFTGVPKA